MVAVIGATATQNSPFPSVIIASTHFAYPWRDGQAELTWVAGYVVRQFTCPKAVTHPNTIRAQYRATVLIKTSPGKLVTKCLHSGFLLELWMTETTGAIRRAKLGSAVAGIRTYDLLIALTTRPLHDDMVLFIHLRSWVSFFAESYVKLQSFGHNSVSRNITR